VITTPAANHLELVTRAIEVGKHVMCEKPFALAAPDAREMCASARSAGVVALVAHEWRWLPGRAAVSHALAAGAVGEPRLVTAIEHLPFATRLRSMAPWFYERGSGGWLGASGTHWIDQILAWFGPFESVCAAFEGIAVEDGSVEDGFTVLFRMASGVNGVLQQCGATFGSTSPVLQVVGTEGTVWIVANEAWIADRDGTRRLPVPEVAQFPVTDELYGVDHVGPMTRLYEAMRARIGGPNAVEHGVVDPPTFDDGLACMEVVDAIRQSAAHGGARVTLRRKDV
jgi:predicted dehydrogenase